MIYIFYFLKKNQFWHQFQFHDYGSTYTTWTSVRLTNAKTIPSSKIRMCHGKNEVNPDGTPERDATNRSNGFFFLICITNKQRPSKLQVIIHYINLCKYIIKLKGGKHGKPLKKKRLN